MRAVAVEGTHAIRYLELPGDGPPLVWIHGFTCSSTGELAPAAAQGPLRDRRSILVDLLGYGYSDRPDDFGYTLEDHARTVGQLIELLELAPCVLVGHSMGGTVATLVAAAQPDTVAALVLAEPGIDPGGDQPPVVAAQTEEAFLTSGFAEMIAGMAAMAAERPEGPAAAHLGITRLVDPRALHRTALSVMRGTQPTVRTRLRELGMPRFYLAGDASDRAMPPQDDLTAAGMVWLTVPDTGHAMGLVNPLGFAASVARALAMAGLASEPAGP